MAKAMQIEIATQEYNCFRSCEHVTQCGFLFVSGPDFAGQLALDEKVGTPFASLNINRSYSVDFTLQKEASRDPISP